MEKKRAPYNTGRDARDFPILEIIGLVSNDGSDILRQVEVQGQHSLVESDALPAKMDCEYDGYYDYYWDAKAILEASGVKFLGAVEGDEIFQYVELPPGWKKVTTHHDYWSRLHDNKGRTRARIFYKASYHDRYSNMTLSCRFNLSHDFDRFEKENIDVVNVYDGDRVIYSTQPVKAVRSRDYCSDDELMKLARDWLNENYPDWRSPGAYWD